MRETGHYLWVMRLQDEDIVIDCDADFNPIVDFDVGEPLISDWRTPMTADDDMILSLSV